MTGCDAASAASRPRSLVVVVGTGTDVGKTWVGARLLEAWRGRDLTVAARKPVQSFEAGAADTGCSPTDADVLAAATGEAPLAVCPAHRWYPLAMAPPMAAQELGAPPFALADLVGELAWPARSVDVGLVETAGGLRSPVADDGDSRALAARVAPDAVVLVADAGLGTVNAVRLSIDALAAVGATSKVGAPRPGVTVVLNRFDPDSDLHRRNLGWLSDRDGLAVAVADAQGLAWLADELSPGPRP